MNKPTPEAILERARSLCNQEMIAVEMQVRRIKSAHFMSNSEIWADFQFLVISLTRMRRAAGLAARQHPSIQAAIRTFDETIPGLKKMRNIAEHIDSYALESDERHDKSIVRGQLQVYRFDGTSFEWLGNALNIEDAYAASIELLRRVGEII